MTHGKNKKNFELLPRAGIVPKHGMPIPTIDELSGFTSKRLAQYKVPEKWIFVKSLPRNAVGKIDRRKLHNLELPGPRHLS